MEDAYDELDAFAERYQKLISWIEPDSVRLCRGLQAVFQMVDGEDLPDAARAPLPSSQQCERR